MENHMIKNHSNEIEDNELECEECGFQASTDFQIRKHIYTQHGMRPDEMIVIKPNNYTNNKKADQQYEYLQYLSDIQSRCEVNVKYSKDDIN